MTTRRVLRRSQAVVPFGVGAVLDLAHESLMAAGLDAWPHPADPGDQIRDPRLAASLGVSHFRMPPAATRPDGRQGDRLPFVRFPRWHFCPRCGALHRVGPDRRRLPRCSSEISLTAAKPCTSRAERSRPVVRPLRFVVACENGHVEDFPWVAWVHSGKGNSLDRAATCSDPRIFRKATGRGGLAGFLVLCASCDSAPRSLAGAASPGGVTGLTCEGRRPWLGDTNHEPDSCDLTLRMLQRGAVSFHFSRVASSLLIPPWSSRIEKVLDDPRWREFLVADAGREIIEKVARVEGVDPDLLNEALRRRQQVQPAPETSELGFRRDEYRALQVRTTSSDDSLVLSSQNLDEYESFLTGYFDKIILVKKLAETRALVGFSRIQPDSRSPFDVTWDQLAVRRKSWLPAYQVFGEGIFLVLKPARVRAWSEQAGGMLTQLLQRARENAGRRFRVAELVPHHVLLHTLAHLLMRRLSFECGYGSSALRERLYVAGGELDGNWMAGILIYTAAGDAQGTLGGLVEQGKPGRFEQVLCNSLLEAHWCSADPLCRSSSGQGTDSLNLAACHTCALVPETSCEEGNRLLDRVAVIGMGDEDDDRSANGYFEPLLRSLLANPAG